MWRRYYRINFGQTPPLCKSTLPRLAVLGYVIIAPTTKSSMFSSTKTVQTRQLINIASSVQVAIEGKANVLHMLGHSIGAANVLAYSRCPPAGAVLSMAMMAPAVANMKLSPLSPYVTLGERNEEETFATEINTLPILPLQGSRDLIV